VSVTRSPWVTETNATGKQNVILGKLNNMGPERCHELDKTHAVMKYVHRQITERRMVDQLRALEASWPVDAGQPFVLNREIVKWCVAVVPTFAGSGEHVAWAARYPEEAATEAAASAAGGPEFTHCIEFKPV
jgi:hypothetical protein